MSSHADTLHKIVAGLLDVHEHVLSPRGDGSAIACAQRLVGYLVGRVDKLRAEQGEEWWQSTLEVEFGGIGEAAYRLATLSAPPPPTSHAAASSDGAESHPWRNASAAAQSLRLARAFVKRRFVAPLSQGLDSLAGLHANTHLPLLVQGARGADAEAVLSAHPILRVAGTGHSAAASSASASAAEHVANSEADHAAVAAEEGLRAALHGYCLLQLGYSFAGALGSSVNEHWPERAASTGSASRVAFAPKGLEDIAGGCMDLADAGECARSASYMLSYCAAACAAVAAGTSDAGASDTVTGLEAEAAQREGEGGAGEGAPLGESAAEGTPSVGGVGGSEAMDSDAFHTQESCTQYNALKLNTGNQAAGCRLQRLKPAGSPGGQPIYIWGTPGGSGSNPRGTPARCNALHACYACCTHGPCAAVCML